MPAWPVVIPGTLHNNSFLINSKAPEATEQQHQQGRAGQVRNELHMEIGQVGDTRPALCHCTWPCLGWQQPLQLAGALGTLSIPFCEVLETEPEFVVVPEELWVVGDLRQENLCNF